MERTRQPIKRHKASSSSSSDVASIDRLSNLPDAIICHILSFLPTKLSVSTGVLSKRWSFLWAHVPNLDFESPELTILDIATRVMSLYKVENIDTFRISYEREFVDDDRSKFRLETCIAVAILRNVKKLRVCFPVMPHGILTCKTLVDLSLRNCADIPMTGNLCLPALKRLHLHSVRYEFQSDKSLEHLLSCCQVLEELIVCFLVSVRNHITSPTLQKLTVNKCSMVNIDAPSLRFLKFRGCTPHSVSKRTVDSLTQVDFVSTIVQSQKKSSVRFKRLAAVLVNRLSNVKCLKFSGAFVADINYGYPCLDRKFHNLTKFELAGDGYGDLLSYILGNAYNLEVLIIDKAICTMDPNQERKCLSSHLRTVRIGRFGCTENEFELVKYLLWNAKVLRRMEIYYQHARANFEAKFTALKRIALFPRGSVACELTFH